MIRYLKKYYLFLLAVLSSIVFVVLFQQTFSKNYGNDIKRFKNEFVELEKSLENSLRYQEEDILRHKIGVQWRKLKKDSPINIHVYSNDSLILWNTNQLPILRFADIHFPSEGLLHLQNGWYFAKTKVVGDYLICGSFLIKQDYSYVNNELINDFDSDLYLPFTASISLEQDRGYPVYDKDKEFVFSLHPNGYQTASWGASIALMLLLLITLCLWLIWLSKWASVKSKYRWFFPLLIVGLRVASLQFNWFGFMHGTIGFDSSLYGTNKWSPNFFEYLLNIAVFIYLLNYWTQYLKRLAIGVFNKYLVGIIFIGSFSFWILFLYVTKGLIEDSSIPLVIDKLFSLDVFSVLSICSLGVFFYAYFQFLKEIVNACKNQEITGAQLAVISFIVSCSFFFYEINYGYQLFLAALFPIVFYELVLYLVYRHVKSNQMGTGIVLLFIFSVVMAQNFGTLNERKEKGERELFANQLTTERSIITEVEYASIASTLKDDNFIRKYIDSPQFMSIDDFQEGIERRIFNGFWERYELSFNLFSEDHVPMIDKRNDNTTMYDDLQHILDVSGKMSEIDSSIYFINDYTKQYSYIIRQEILSKDSLPAILFCTLKSKKIPEEIGFPRLLISSKANVLESLESYSIGKYHNGRLITKYGGFKYPSFDNVMIPNRIIEKGYFDYRDYNHLVLKKSDNNSVVLSVKNRTFFDFITSFSYLFTFFGLLLLPLVFRLNSTKGFSSTLTLALKIQVVFISLVFISLLAFGWGSGIFVSNQYNQFTDDVIREKLNSVETELKSKLNQVDKLSIEENGNSLQLLLQGFAKVFFTDINLYDQDGYLLASSRPKVFNVGLLSEQMNPIAFKNVKFLKQSEFIQSEKIGELNYSSAYQPIYNSKNKLLGYINLQHFGQQREFENQIQKFLVAIINVFILLLAISIILAIFISNWLTAPLRILQTSFSKVKFGKHNEQIQYEKEDEIGALVKDYNKKLEELEFAAQQLAKNEREMAWREMAKQVAHEIKNPLTPMKLSVQQLLRSYNPDDPKNEDKLKRVANSIIEQIDALTKIANEFSTFAKMPNPNEEKVEILNLIAGVTELFTEIEGSAITIDTELEELYINGDKDQFVRVFNNLIKNALQSIPLERNGKVVIKIQKKNGKAIILIEDNGIGIEESKQHKIFVPYFTTKSNGTGLGLAMVKQIIENHNGTISFESSEGTGTVFRMEVPFL